MTTQQPENKDNLITLTTRQSDNLIKMATQQPDNNENQTTLTTRQQRQTLQIIPIFFMRKVAFMVFVTPSESL